MIRFKVFGVDPAIHDRYAKMITKWMSGKSSKYDIEYVMDVDQFIQYGITSIPSVIVHTEIKLEEKDYKDQDSFSDAFRDLTKKLNSIE